MEVLNACDLAERALPGWRGGEEGEARMALVGALEAISPPVEPEVLLAALLPANANAVDGALRSLRASTSCESPYAPSQPRAPRSLPRPERRSWTKTAKSSERSSS